ncbi:MAG: MTH895/ArsE family thioredoxin-like protein [Candidatus Saccharibacteria bacterium]
MKIEVVGTGCATCQQLYKITQQAAADINPKTLVEYKSNQAGMERLLELGLMQSPALVVDGKIAMIGYSPSIQKIKNAILETASR